MCQLSEYVKAYETLEKEIDGISYAVSLEFQDTLSRYIHVDVMEPLSGDEPDPSEFLRRFMLIIHLPLVVDMIMGNFDSAKNSEYRGNSMTLVITYRSISVMAYNEDGTANYTVYINPS